MLQKIASSPAMLLGLVGASAIIGAGAVLGVEAARSTAAVPGQAGIEQVVRNYVLTHPEIIPEAMQRLRARETGQEIAANRSAILEPFGSAWAGNPKGDLTIVEYFDYNCGYCRSSLPVIDRLIASDPKLRVVFRELPILSDESKTAARLSLVAAERGRFKAFHNALYAGGPISEASLESAIRAAGLDPRAAQAAATLPRIEAELKSNLNIASRLGMTGTPSWIIGNQVISSALPFEDLQKAIAEARAQQ
ncbi:MAG: DsbA family protein [Sphingomonas sp.]|jgi:protein-disulfide isomerase